MRFVRYIHQSGHAVYEPTGHRDAGHLDSGDRKAGDPDNQEEAAQRRRGLVLS